MFGWRTPQEAIEHRAAYVLPPDMFAKIVLKTEDPQKMCPLLRTLDEEELDQLTKVEEAFKKSVSRFRA